MNKEEIYKGIKDAITDCEKVIDRLVDTKCNEVWSVIKLNNIIHDLECLKDFCNPLDSCNFCSGDLQVEDTEGNIWPCHQCEEGVSNDKFNKLLNVMIKNSPYGEETFLPDFDCTIRELKVRSN